MILPSTLNGLMILLAVSLALLGSWTSTWVIANRGTRKLRFELYYVPFNLGVVLTAVVAAYTFGSLAPNELTFQDNYMLTGYRNMAWALIAGAVVNLGTVLLLGSVSVAGMSVAFPVCFGFAYAIDALWSYIVQPNASITVAAGGTLVMLIAVGLAAVAYTNYLSEEADKKIKALNADPRISQKKRPPKPLSALPAILLALIGGICYGVLPRLVGNAMVTEVGISAYGVMLLFAPAMFFSSIVYLVFLMNFPVNGPPITFSSFGGVSKGSYLWGLIGGILWAAGVLLMLLVWDVDIALNQPTEYLLTHAAPLLAILWGMLIWRDLPNASLKVKLMRVAVLVLFAAGLAVISTLPLSAF